MIRRTALWGRSDRLRPKKLPQSGDRHLLISSSDYPDDGSGQE